MMVVLQMQLLSEGRAVLLLSTAILLLRLRVVTVAMAIMQKVVKVGMLRQLL